MSKGDKHYVGHRRRLKQRLVDGGRHALHDYELLELLLAYAIPRKDTKLIAKQLLDKFNCLGEVLNTPQEELKGIKGIGENSAVLVRLVREIHTSCLAEELTMRVAATSVKAVVEFSRAEIGYLPYEVFMIVYLNTRNEVLANEIVHEGTIDRAHIYPRRVAETALRRRAAGLILVHNHPSGHPRPSEADTRITRVLAKALLPLDIHILDHIIIGQGSYFSFAEHQLL